MIGAFGEHFGFSLKVDVKHTQRNTRARTRNHTHTTSLSSGESGNELLYCVFLVSRSSWAKRPMILALHLPRTGASA